MKKISVLLLSLLIAFQLSAQKKDVPDNQDEPNQFPRMEQGAPDMNNQQGKPMAPRGEKQRHGGEGFCQERPPFDFCLQKLNDKEKEQFFAMQKDFKKSVKPMKSELRLRRAELDYLTQADEPSIDQISKKLDEIGSLDKKIKLEEIKFGIKLKKAIPSLDADFPISPMH